MSISLDDLFYNENYPDLLVLMELVKDKLAKLCSCTGKPSVLIYLIAKKNFNFFLLVLSDTEIFYKLNENQVMSWLDSKMDKMLDSYDSFMLFKDSRFFSNHKKGIKKSNSRTNL